MPWYDPAVTRAKKNASAARKSKDKNVSSNHNSFYKKLLAVKFKNHTAKVTGQLRSININDPRKYYQILNQAVKQKTPTDLPIDEFEEHFKNLNTTKQGNLIETENGLNATNSESNFTEDLNGPVTEEESEKALKSLKNNKATGPDK